ncbi:MAG TPA: hypothetical protein ENI13_01075 [candidate division CPR3 bacterium]|uniref:Uncharacterized protein n=1 Tax=candidate division CPR3 bacterium TaxID=2268181 RepID=A0A7C1SNV9_UNCC3|nr:hypothetical protein [candidate division CPR3 bacterium]
MRVFIKPDQSHPTEYMILEQQLTILETSKKLKELGVKQESMFYWKQDLNGVSWILVYVSYIARLKNEVKANPDIWISAFTVTELGEIMKDKIEPFPPMYDSSMENWNWQDEVIADTEAEVRGRMLVFLLENKLIEL